MLTEQSGFVLTSQWRDKPGGIELSFWVTTDNGPFQLIIADQQAVFFVAADQAEYAQQLLAARISPPPDCKSLALKNFQSQSVSAFYFRSQRSLREARDILMAVSISVLEADIKPQDRFLMERFVRGGLSFSAECEPTSTTAITIPSKITASDYHPDLSMVSLDIETAMHGLALYSIGLYSVRDGEVLRKVLMVSEQSLDTDVEIFSNEKALLQRFFQWLADFDPDIIIGWNVVNFDMWYLQRVCDKHGLQFVCGRSNSKAYWRTLDEESERRKLQIPGRVVLDGIELLKIGGHRFDSFALNPVANILLDDGKLIQSSDRGEKITELFFVDKQALADYNLQDCKLVWDIFEKAALLDFAIARTQLTGLSLDRLGGSVAAFDFRYLPLLHRQGYVAPNGHQAVSIEQSPGGFVMNSSPGIYDYVAVLDFKSLYPSIIRSFKIDPMGMVIGLQNDFDQTELVPGFDGAWFAKNNNILPALIEELWSSRDYAKQNNDKALSQAIKILMNSFYGVLGSAGCRFFDSRLASSITRRGHQILQQTAAFIEAEGWSVIYGDTDSVFVWLKDCADSAQARTLAAELESALNKWWRDKLQAEYAIDSALEIEFETLYDRFLMPTMRGSEHGSKKRYAGVVTRDGQTELVFKGLENVRTDWTRLARDFQMELYRRVFFDEPYREFVQQTVADVMQGKYDDQLIYRKRLRRKLADYQRNIPPHVQAARKSTTEPDKRIRRGDWIEYVITLSGPEPVDSQHSALDYQHYIDRQLAPVADSILYFLSDSLAAVTDQQLGLFS